MELGPSLAPELLAAADPLSRATPDFLRPPGRGPDAGGAKAPFELLLQLLGKPLPEALPGGEILPAGGSALPAADTPTTDSDALAASAAAAALPGLGLPLPSPATAPAVASSTSSVQGALDSQPTLADALRRAFVITPNSAEAAQTSAPAVDSPAAAPADAFDAPVAPSVEPAAPGGETPLDVDALPALEAARASVPQAAESFPLRRSGAADSRTRAPSITPAERAFALATQLARADAPSGDAEAPRAFDLQAATTIAESPVPMRGALLDDALPIGVATDGVSPTSFAAPAPGSSGTAGTVATGAAPQTGQPPPQLGTPVDTQAARWHEALASRIQWAVDHKIGEAQIKLNPPELGALDVKISIQDDKTFVQMTAHSAAARDELSQSLPRLRELMSAGGLDLGGATVSGGRDDRSGYQAAAQPTARALGFASDSVDVPSDLPRLRPGAASRIDLFA